MIIHLFRKDPVWLLYYEDWAYNGVGHYQSLEAKDPTSLILREYNLQLKKDDSRIASSSFRQPLSSVSTNPGSPIFSSSRAQGRI